MNGDDAISISSGDEEDRTYNERRAILEPAIRSVVDALGGHEGGAYRLGDECYGCLKDLKKFWRKDDTDDERTVARIFWETRVLPNDLIPILMETASKGNFEDKRAIAVADLMTAMTWPIDLAEELQELDEVNDKGTDYTQLLHSHLAYKAAILKPGVLQALFGIILVCLAKDKKERTERDVQIIHVVLYLIRNLAFIKDLPANMHLSADQAEYSSLQGRLIRILSETQISELLMTIASNATTDSMFNTWNTLILEILYLLYRGVKPSTLATDQAKAPAKNLQRLLAVEDQRKRDFAQNASTRHSRFGTTISVTLNPKKAAKSTQDSNNATDQPEAKPSSSQALVLHRQQAINREAGSILDMASSKKWKYQKVQKLDELAREDNLSLEARLVLQQIAKTFIESCFNSLLASLLKDIKAERPKITEKDNLRLLYVTKWFLEFFQAIRAADKERLWEFGLIAEVTDRSWIVWVLKRMREAVEEKPKLWNELQAGVECLTQLVLLIDAMTTSSDSTIAEAAEILQHQIVYNGDTLDIAFDSLKMYKEGTQSLQYLDSSVYLAYALLRMLEKWGKSKGSEEFYVRRKVKKAKTKKNKDGEEVADVEEEVEQEPEEIVHEIMFSFEAFELRFANADVTQTLLTYLSRYKEFSSSENMKRIVNLLHRQAVKAKAEGLFFKVSTLDLFKTILADEKSMPKERPYKELISLINFILHKFFKAVAEDSFLIVEAFFPKNRSQWKQFSSWEPEEKTSKAGARTVEDTRFPPDVQVKKGYKWSEQLAIAMQCLVDDGKMGLIEWVKQILIVVIGQRQRIIEDTDGSPSEVKDQVDANEDKDDEDDLEALTNRQNGPSSEAMAKFTDYMIPYISDEQADAATRDPHLKLMLRLMQFYILDEDADELEWYVPAAIMPTELQRSLNVLNQYLENPLDIGGKKAAQLLQKKRRRRTRRRRSPSPSDNEHNSDDEDLPRRKKKKEKKKKEEQKYKSAQFIEDSDADEDAMEAFFTKEKALREKTALAAATTGKIATMKATGTKKRRKKNEGDGAGKRKRKRGDDDDTVIVELDKDGDLPTNAIVEVSSGEEFDPFASPKSPKAQTPAIDSDVGEVMTETKARPRPRPRPKQRISTAVTSDPPIQSPTSLQPPPSPRNSLSGDDSPIGRGTLMVKKKAVLISDDEE